MFRTLSLGIGGFLVALGVLWFFTSVLDGLPATLTTSSTVVTPMSKMTFADSFSMLFAGLTVTGFLLLSFGIVRDESSTEDAGNSVR